MTEATLAVELFTEELPPKALRRLGRTFADTLAQALLRDGLSTPASIVTPYTTPRRLGVTITGARSQAADAVVVEKLMPRLLAEDAAGKITVPLL